MRGQVAVLNVGAGDIKLSFDKDNPAERIRAARIVTDMLRRGYALLVEIPAKKKGAKPTYQRCVAFDENTCEYIVVDFDPSVAIEEPDAQIKTPSAKEKKGRPTKRLNAAKTRSTAIAPSAGG